MTSVTRGRSHLLGIFVIALAVLAYQILLTRVFSVMLYYHFAFAAVSLVMLGLTIGAERVYLHPDRYRPDILDEQWARSALGFAWSSIAVVLWFVYAPLLLPEGLALPVVACSLVLFVIPLIYSGICVTLILTRSHFSIGRLYAADLIGAAAGCVGIVAVLSLLDPISIFFGIAALVAAAAMLLAPAATVTYGRARIATLVLCGACALQGGLYASGHDHLRVVWAKGKPQQGILYERWNAFSRIRVAPYHDQTGSLGQPLPFGWGFGHIQHQTIDQDRLDIDADAGTVLTRFDGKDLKPFAFLGNDVINMAYHVRPMDKVAVIGVGGGRDLMSALYFGVPHITGIELNPIIFDVLTRKFADLTGHLYQRPELELVNAEARSWINRTPQHFDLVQISLIDTWAATAAGGLTMSENKLYTVDAWQDFLDRLTPGGMLVVSRWFNPVNHKAEFYRLLSLAVAALENRGVAASEVQSHIMAVGVNGIVTVMVSPNPFTAAERAQAGHAAAQEGFAVMVDRDHAWDAVSATIASGRASPVFYDSLASDISAPTDNRPFFFYTWKPLSFLFAMDQIETANSIRNDIAVVLVGALLLGTFVCVCFFVIKPLMRVRTEVPLRKLAPYLGYFAGIGIGFMLIEISQMQRLMVFLGEPVYGLTVVLFTLLLFGGLGSMTVPASSDPAAAWRRPAVCCAVLIATGLLTPGVTHALKAADITARILASVALLAPAGFCMGMMFPTGMVMSRRYQAQQAWFWGVNGATSVFASVLGIVISMEFGIAQAYWTGVFGYGLCLALVVQQVRQAASALPSVMLEAAPTA